MFTSLKAYFFLIVLGIVALGIIMYQRDIINQKNAVIKQTANNYKALENNVTVWKDNYNQEHARIIEYQQNLYQFKNSKDSLSKLLQKAIKDSKIKDKNLVQAGIVISELKAKIKADSANSTVIITSDSTKEQTLGDSTFTAVARINSKKAVITDLAISANIEQDIIFFNHKETINPSRKFILWRLFQKKQVICDIEIVNKNKGVHTKQAKFTKIIK